MENKSKCTMHSTGQPHYKRIERGGKIIGFASQLSSRGWIAVNDKDLRITDRTFPTAERVRRFFEVWSAPSPTTQEAREQ